MDESVTLEQAKTIAEILPVLMRRLAGPNDNLAAKLPLTQLKVCGVLFRGPRRMSGLSRELGVSLSSLTQIADRLESAGMVKRVAYGADRRVRYLQLTARGKGLIRLREDARVRRTRAVLEHLPPKLRREVVAALEAFARACAEDGGEDVAPRSEDAAYLSELVGKANR